MFQKDKHVLHDSFLAMQDKKTVVKKKDLSIVQGSMV